MRVSHMTPSLAWLVKVWKCNMQGQCFTNAGSLVILSSFENEVSNTLNAEGWQIFYALGILKPPPVDERYPHNYDEKLEPHAWIQAISKNGQTYYWDPTLQGTSPTWGLRSREFNYNKILTMDATEIKTWFRTKYPASEFTDFGIPVENYRFPIIDIDGNVS